ncbi:MAG: hypothetical protein KA204_04540 [Chromatiaceae bacterium]|nr:hypothetical protein [Chromatiaceae bacterium]MBP6733944.1 hypothetical protein [Chromatiaceae bacterium]MBP6806981.1 hypothetical protein [Chromatiaceae bacterium]MBP8288562.1 hypothetical protein [Chromatiaceae bacterium]MBP9602707.1 hypothetical protein [Chromatiaceae bacterium]
MHTPGVLASYFKAWEGGWVAEPLIGLLIGLLGTRVRPLAEGYLQSRPFDLLMDEIPWQDLGGDPMRQTWMDGLSRERLMAEIQLAVRVLEGDCIEVPNLLGEWISLPIAREVGSLLVGGIHWMGGYRALIQFRRIDPSTFDESRLGDLLRGAAEALYAGLYDQPPVDLGGLCRDLSQSDQVEIRVARRLILDHVPFYLRQLTVGRESLRQALTRIDGCRRRIAELDAKQRDSRQERQSQSQAMDALADLIEGDADASAEVLAGVRAKLAQFQYEPASIAFELFQNADDAAVELGQIEAHPAIGCEVPNGARRLVVEQDANGLRFLHWGRPINARGPAGFDGEGRGFGRDLEKMLVLSASDKQPEQGVTGKFGLGFKSVLLACDRPRILSGRLALEVVAGILPQPWRDSAGGRETMARHAPLGPRLPGTLIELPGVDPAKQDQVLERFRALAGVLCIFARALRGIRVCDGAKGQDQEFTWQPRCVLPGVEVGRLHLNHDDWGAETEALRVRMEGGTLLLALGPGGFRLLPKATPSLWVTAPLRETDGLGFACTAPFDLDPGRARLAGDSHQNLAVAQGLGAAAGDTLGALFERGRSDWPGLYRDLGLDPGLSLHDLWHSLWTCLTERWLGRTKDAAAVLGRGLVLALVKRLSARKAAVPNGLPGPFQALIDLGDARYQLPKALATPDAIAVLDAWERFTAKYPRQHLVSEGQGRILKEGDMAKPVALALPALVALVEPPQVTARDAEVLGEIHRLMEDDREWGGEEVKKRLRGLRFRTADNTWVEAARLVAGAAEGIEKDEALRYHLAPAGRRLHPDYWSGNDGEAQARMDFFTLARERLQAGTEDLAQWTLHAQDETMRRAALRYLVRGQCGSEVARRVRGQGWLATVLGDEARLQGFEPTQRQELRRLLATDVQIDRGLEPDWSPEFATTTSNGIDLGDALGRIAAWWSREGTATVRDYRQRIYPAGGIQLALDLATGRYDRSSWLTLLALGAFQGMGRTREGQHRNFIEHCQRKGWWRTFSEVDPKLYPNEWMEIIEDYAEGQHDDEQWSQWIGQFPKLYRLARWLDEYVELFLSIDRYTTPFSLDSLRTPRASFVYQGGGIDAPPLNRTLKVGGPLVIRELLYHGVIRKDSFAVPHAYAPIQRIRDWFAKFGANVETSKDIHDLLSQHLGAAEASFGGAYDIPLRIITADDDLQRVVFR